MRLTHSTLHAIFCRCQGAALRASFTPLAPSRSTTGISVARPLSLGPRFTPPTPVASGHNIFDQSSWPVWPTCDITPLNSFIYQVVYWKKYNANYKLLEFLKSTVPCKNKIKFLEGLNLWFTTLQPILNSRPEDAVQCRNSKKWQGHRGVVEFGCAEICAQITLQKYKEQWWPMELFSKNIRQEVNGMKLRMMEKFEKLHKPNWEKFQKLISF